MTVSHTWRAYGLQPHRHRSFKLSNDSEFSEKLTDVVGLYINPPDKAMVICMDEKPGIRALDRSQTILPARPGMPAGMSNEYVRNGTMDLFAALNILDGTVVTQLHERHRHQEFLIFLREVDRKVSRELDVHMVLVVREAPELQAPLRPHRRVLAEPGRVVVQPTNREADTK